MRVQVSTLLRAVVFSLCCASSSLMPLLIQTPNTKKNRVIFIQSIMQSFVRHSIAKEVLPLSVIPAKAGIQSTKPALYGRVFDLAFRDSSSGDQPINSTN